MLDGDCCVGDWSSPCASVAPKPLSRIVAARSLLNGVGFRARIFAVAGDSLLACGGSADAGKETDLRRVAVGVGCEVEDGSGVEAALEAAPFESFMSTSSMANELSGER